MTTLGRQPPPPQKPRNTALFTIIRHPVDGEDQLVVAAPVHVLLKGMGIEPGPWLGLPLETQAAILADADVTFDAILAKRLSTKARRRMERAGALDDEMWIIVTMDAATKFAKFVTQLKQYV